MIEVNDSDFENIKTMPFYQFRRWLEEYFEDCGLKDQAYKEGYDEGIDDYETEHEDDFDNGKEEGIQDTSEEILLKIQEVLNKNKDSNGVAILKLKKVIEGFCEKYEVPFYL